MQKLLKELLKLNDQNRSPIDVLSCSINRYEASQTGCSIALSELLQQCGEEAVGVPPELVHWEREKAVGEEQI